MMVLRPAGPPGPAGAVVVRLYVSGTTPNSVRAEVNLAAALARADFACQAVRQETVDVFFEPKRALLDGIIVIPTLLVISEGRRTMLTGDLSDGLHLDAVLAGAGAAMRD